MTDPAVLELLRAFFAKYTASTYKKGHIIVPAFSTPPGVYLIKSGLVKQYTLTPQGHELIVNIYKPGAFFPMMWAITQLPNNYFYETLEDTDVFRAPVADTLEFIKTQPEVMFDLLKRLYTGLDGVLQQMTFSAISDTPRKVIAGVVMLAKRFGEKQGNKYVVEKHFSHKEISLVTGTSRESVTRVLSDLEDEGLLKIDHKVITIPDLTKLEEKLLSS